MIVVVSPDPAVCEFLVDNLLADGFEAIGTDRLDCGARLARRAAGESVVVADVAPDSGHWPAIIAARAQHESVRVLALRDAEASRSTLPLVPGLADDELRKPFAYLELRLRVSRLLEHAERSRSAIVVGELRLDLRERSVSVAGTPVDLTRKEFALLRTLAGEPTRVFTKQELLRDIWGYEFGSSRTLDSHACRLRHKLRSAHGDIEPGPDMVQSIWGVGYRLAEPSIPAMVAA